MKNINYKSIKGYICFKLLAKADKQIIPITNATIESTTLEIVPIEYNNEVIYLAAGNLGIHWIKVSSPGYQIKNPEMEVTQSAQNMDIYLDSTGEKPNSMKQSM